MNAGTYQQVSADVVDGMGGVMNDKHLEAKVMGQQVSVENVVPLLAVRLLKRKKCKRVKMLGKHLKEMLIKL